MLKILFLRFHYRLSDRQMMERTKTDMAFRWSLGLGMLEAVPNHTNGTHFRNRIGAERFNQVFQGIISQAREQGLVRDRLRLKDATHLLAVVADLRPLALVAQVRDHLLCLAKPFFADWVQEQQIRIETLRQTTAELSDDDRLAARVEQLREMAAQLVRPACRVAVAAVAGRPSETTTLGALTAKLLADRDDPEAPDRLVSATDPRKGGLTSLRSFDPHTLG